LRIRRHAAPSLPPTPRALASLKLSRAQRHCGDARPSYDNRINLAARLVQRELSALYEGTRFGRHEIVIRSAHDVQGALGRAYARCGRRLAAVRVLLLHMARVVVGVDPSCTMGQY